MDTFYRPGIFEILLHGVFGRHSWFFQRYVNRAGKEETMVLCRICYKNKDYKVMAYELEDVPSSG